MLFYSLLYISHDIAPELHQGHVAAHDTGDTSVDAAVLTDRKSEKKKDEDEKDKGKEKENDGETEKDKPRGPEGTNLDGLLQRLPGCVSRDLINQLTVEFCYLNSKSSRKKLARALFNVPRTSLELLPYYSRMVATLSTCMKDVPSTLLQLFEEEFNFLINKKLCKFKIAPSVLIFSCLKACLDDFTHHNIDVACNLLETCGRYLYWHPDTNVRMANMLEILMRLKTLRIWILGTIPLWKTRITCTNHLNDLPESPKFYIRKLLFTDLDKSLIEQVLRQLRKLPWSECQPYLLKCFWKVHKGKYGQIHLIASLTARLSRYHDEFAVAIVDEVLEEIRLGLEVNEYGMQRRRIAHMRFLGELYNYEHVDSSVVLDTLYLILIFGHGTEEQDVLDPPEDCFRIRMIITLLETCGHYFGRGSSKRKLDRFLIHFQRYILSKGALPLDIEFDLQVTI
uniref:Putative armadillo-type fold protein n=1 Tax=Helianthus annuus TaxID=4232 RepID=A0A251V8M7_HELAN